MPTDKSVQIEVKGLRELAQGFRQLDDGLDQALKRELLGVATMVAGVIQQRMPFRTGRMARSIKPRASTRGASIAAYGQAAPYGPFMDFGGSTGRGHRPRQYWSGAIKREWRGVPVGDGRYLYPGITESRKETEEAALDAVMAAAKKANFDTRG